MKNYILFFFKNVQKTGRKARLFFIYVCTFLTFVVSVGTVPGAWSLKNVQKQDGMLAFFHFRLHLSDLCGAIGYCAWRFVPKQRSKTRRNARIFFYFRLHLSDLYGVRNHQNRTPNPIKITKNGGPGGSWGGSWRHLDPQSAQS